MSETGAPLGASVVVCTRNRAGELGRSLDTMLRLEAPFDWELIVVDNGSDDDTVALVTTLAERRSGRLSVSSEPVLGLSAARNRGVRLARGAWIGFLDDDAEPCREWLEAIDAELRLPGVLAVGGPVEPVYSDALPDWLTAPFLPYLSVWDLGSEERDLGAGELPRGANLAVRREAFERYGGFDPRLGRVGRSLRSGEDTELALRIVAGGQRVRYAPAARARHRIETARLSPDWLLRRCAAQGFSEAIIDWKHQGWKGLQAGLARSRAALDWVRLEGAAPDSLRFLSVSRQSSAYRRGAVYAPWAVARWKASR